MTSFKNILDKTTMIRIAIIFILAVLIILFVRNDYFLYDRPIVTIDSVENSFLETRTGTTDTKTYEEKYYKQTIKGTVRNGSHKGETVTLQNTFSESGVYDTEYKKGDDVFIDSSAIAGTKRDHFVISVLTILFGLFLLVGGKEAILTMVSLGLNMAAFWFVLRMYLAGSNILVMMIPLSLFFTLMLLVFMYGRNARTLLAFVSSAVSMFAVLIIAFIAMRIGGGADYDFMDYLIQPYDTYDADLIFMSEVLIGCMGAVMDVVITIVMTAHEISVNLNEKLSLSGVRTASTHIRSDAADADPAIKTDAFADADPAIKTDAFADADPAIKTDACASDDADEAINIDPFADADKKAFSRTLRNACRNVGDDIIGTMIPVVFFTNIAASIPFFILSMRNGFAMTTILKHHVFFEVARFLTGSIGVVIAVPIATFISVWYYNRHIAKMHPDAVKEVETC